MTHVPQHIAALNAANEIRYARARLKREVRALPIKESMLRLADLLEGPPPEMLTERIEKALVWARQMGTFRAARMLINVRVSGARTVRDLSPRQRALLADALRSRAMLAPLDPPVTINHEEFGPPVQLDPATVDETWCRNCSEEVVPTGSAKQPVCGWCDTRLTLPPDRQQAA